MPVMIQDRLAFDKSVREIDQDGHLHIAVSNISKANICEYLGSEIPGASGLGLNPDKLYKLLRDPDELKKSAETFNGKPLLVIHKSQSAATHDHNLTVGSVSGMFYEKPYLKARIDIWDADAIADINSGKRRELSSSYRYEYDPTPGVYEGEPYDGRMVNIVGNHVALVEKGRAGPDVLVGDSALPTIGAVKMVKRKAALVAIADAHTKAAQAIANDAALKPAHARLVKLATDAMEKAKDMDPDEDMSDAADPEDETEAEKKMRMAKEAKDKKAKDAKAAKDKAARDKKAKDEEDDDDSDGEQDDKIAELKEQIADLKDDLKEASDKDKKGMDAAISAAVLAERNAARALRDAETAVRPYVGEISVAMDSAAAVYRYALEKNGVDVKGVHESAFPALLGMLRRPGERQPVMAADAVAVKGFNERWPTAGKLKIAS